MSTLRASNIYDKDGGSNAVLYGVAAPTGSMGNRNRIINGDMRIDQRNAGASVTVTDSNPYTLDRWQAISSTSASKYTLQQSTTAPSGFSNSLLVTSSSAYSVLTGDYFFVRTKIEGYNVADLAFGTASAATVTVSFWVRSSLTGTFGGSLRNSASNRSYPFTYTISAANTWEQKSVTIAGDTTGTWLTNNGIGLDVSFAFGVGTTFSGTAGAWAGANYASATGATSVVGTNGATFYITGVQLEAGSVASPFERRPYGQELALCQRYYQYDTYVIWSGNVTSGEAYYMYKSFPVAMRAAPTMGYTRANEANFPATAATTNQVTFQQVSFQRTANGTGRGYFTDSITMNAEL